MSDIIVEFEFNSSYSASSGCNVITEEVLERLQAICSRPVRSEQLSKRHIDLDRTTIWGGEEKDHPDLSVLTDKYYIGGYTNIAPLHQLLAIDGVQFSIKNRIKEVPEYSVEETILHKLMSLESKLSVFDESVQFNSTVGVHISDLGLLSVRQVTWLEDACTEELQRQLDDGWRIIAVCPQPDSRRPDYILGRN